MSDQLQAFVDCGRAAQLAVDAAIAAANDAEYSRGFDLCIAGEPLEQSASSWAKRGFLAGLERLQLDRRKR